MKFRLHKLSTDTQVAAVRHSLLRQARLVVVLALVLSLGSVGTAIAAQSTSSNYSVNEIQFGTGGSLNDCSASYCARTSAGDTVVGRGDSTNYSAQFGGATTDEPLLQVLVTGGSQNMGELDDNTTGTATNSIKVRSYLSNGYSLQITGAPPSQGTHSLTRLASPSTSQPGMEQFGINLAANTSPAIGANPVQVPSTAFSFGVVQTNYSQQNLFMYEDGGVVATSDVSTGETDYTMSMIINVSKVTPGGFYNGTFSAVVVPYY